jgi:hypothetical protein
VGIEGVTEWRGEASDDVEVKSLSLLAHLCPGDRRDLVGATTI